MEANELKIGNLVKCNPKFSKETSKLIEYEDEIVKIKHISEKETEWWSLGCHITQLIPIPLTEEWLRRLGFETESYISTGTFMIRGTKRIVISDNRGEWEYNLIVSADDNDNWRVLYETNPRLKPSDRKEIDITLKSIQYVHQLQNYFALIGEELTLICSCEYQTSKNGKKIKTLECDNCKQKKIKE